jgi:hypothetical protein
MFPYKLGGGDTLSGCISLCRAINVTAADLLAKINRAAKQGAQVADRAVSLLQVLPRRLHDVRQALACFSGLAHQTKDQKFRKTQGQQTLKVRRHVPRLSLLKSGRVKIPYICAVCHGGTRRIKALGRRRLSVDRRALRRIRRRHGCLDQTEQNCFSFRKVQVGATEATLVAFRDDTQLARASNETSALKVGEGAIQRAFRLNGAVGQTGAADIN